VAVDGARNRENRLGEYLRARRALVSPARSGLAPGLRRRVPGLRREEVALLAGISADYYLRLERGRDANPSPQVLQALARVLHLDDVETAYLLDLARTPPRTRPGRRRREHVPDRLHHLLATVGVPAFVEGRTFDVLASNPLAVALSPRLRPGENRLRSLFLDPAEREFHRDWEAATAEFVGAFRRSVGDPAGDPAGAVHDAAVVELVGELSLASARFRTLWERHDVRRLAGGTTVVEHPVAGELRLHRDKLPVEGLVLVLYHPDADGVSAQRLDLLGRLLADPAADRAADRADPADASADLPAG